MLKILSICISFFLRYSLEVTIKIKRLDLKAPPPMRDPDCPRGKAQKIDEFLGTTNMIS